MEQKKLSYNPAVKAIPKVVAFEMLCMIAGAVCIVFISDYGLYIGIALIFAGSILGAGLLTLCILKVRCPDCDRVTSLDRASQIRTCDDCAVEWSVDI